MKIVYAKEIYVDRILLYCKLYSSYVLIFNEIYDPTDEIQERLIEIFSDKKRVYQIKQLKNTPFYIHSHVIKTCLIDQDNKLIKLNSKLINEGEDLKYYCKKESDKISQQFFEYINDHINKTKLTDYNKLIELRSDEDKRDEISKQLFGYIFTPIYAIKIFSDNENYTANQPLICIFENISGKQFIYNPLNLNLNLNVLYNNKIKELQEEYGRNKQISYIFSSKQILTEDITDYSDFFISTNNQSMLEKFRQSPYQSLKLAFIELNLKKFMDDESIKKIKKFIMMEHSIESKEFTLMNSIYYPTYPNGYLKEDEIKEDEIKEDEIKEDAK